MEPIGWLILITKIELSFNLVMSRNEILLILSSNQCRTALISLNRQRGQNYTIFLGLFSVFSLGLYCHYVPVGSVESVLAVLRAHPVPPLHHPHDGSFLDVADHSLLVVYQRNLLTLLFADIIHLHLRYCNSSYVTNALQRSTRFCW